MSMKSTFTIIDHVFLACGTFSFDCLSSIILHLARGYFGHMDKGRWRAAAFRPLIGSFDGPRTKRDLYGNTPALTRGLGFWVLCAGLPNSVTSYMRQGVFGTLSNQNAVEQHKKWPYLHLRDICTYQDILLMVTFIKIYLIQYSTLSYSCGYDIISSLIYENHLFKLLINILCEQHYS